MAAKPSGPRYQLARELRELRTRARFSAEQAARALRVTAETIRRYERGGSIIGYADLMALLELYGVTDPEDRRVLDELREQADQKVWWSSMRLPENAKRLVGFEDAAVRIRMFELGLVPGPLQTEEYARAAMRAVEPSATDEAIDRAARLRLQRQERVYRRGRPDVTVILAEQALRTVVGGVELMREQLAHLLKGPCPYQLRVIPQHVGPHPGSVGSFHIFDFDPKTRASAVYVEAQVKNFFADDEKSVAAAELSWKHMVECALPDRDSRALVTSLIEELQQ